MVKNIKRILCALLIIVILSIFRLLPIVYNVYAVDNVSGDYEYKLDEENNAIITKYNGSEKNLTIPAVLDGKNVTKIGENAFVQNDYLESLVILDNVIDIEENAFSSCTNLKKVKFSNNLNSIGKWAFANCNNLLRIEIPDSVVKIEVGAFQNCNKLECVRLSESLEMLPRKCFYNCSNLYSIKIPKKINSIESDALPFYITIYGYEDSYVSEYVKTDSGKTLKTINNDKVDFTYVEMPNDGLIELKITGYYGFDNDVIIPEVIDGYKVTMIDYRALAGCLFEKVIMPNSITSIGTFSFLKCSYLKSIELSEDLKYLERSAFEGCSSLEKIVIPEEIGAIGESAFMNCINLKEVSLPKKLSNIREIAFYGCEKLESINIPENVTTIEQSAFYGCSSLEKIKLPKSLRTLSDGVFCNCENLKQIIIPTDVYYIAKDAFKGCSKLTIYGYSNSYAQEYALKNTINFILLKDIGDINGDGKVNMKDWNRLYNHINETDILTGNEFTCADVNQDGKVNMKDWNRMYEHISEINPLF